MTDFAPRDTFDIHAAIREANIKTAGLFGWHLPVPPATAPHVAEASSTPVPSHAPQPSAGVSAVSFMDDGGVSSILAKNARGEW